jgi:hypothetical protein
MGQLIYGPQSSPPVTYIPGGSSSIAPSTAFAFTLYDPEAFNNAGNSAEQPSSSQDTWLDSNGLEVLISRDSGMLLKSE